MEGLAGAATVVEGIEAVAARMVDARAVAASVEGRAAVDWAVEKVVAELTGGAENEEEQARSSLAEQEG